MKSLSTILPWLLVVTIAAIAIGWMLHREMAAAKWLFGLLLLAHGAVHLLFAVPEPDGGPQWPFTMDRSWAITRVGLEQAVVRNIGWVLIVIAVAGFLLAALGATGIVVPHSWWQATVAIGAVASSAVLVLFFDPQLVIGIGINVLLVWAVAATSVADELIVVSRS